MKQSNQTYKNNEIQIISYTSKVDWVDDFEIEMKTITNDYQAISGSFVGFNDKDDFIKYMSWYMNPATIKNMPEADMSSKIQEIIVKAMKICLDTIPNKINTIFVYPTENTFVVDKMGGVNGFTPSKDILILFVSLKSDFEKALTEIVAHEYNHSIFWRNNKWNTLLQGFVAEGLAELFREELVHGDLAPWSTAHNYEECAKWYNKLKSKNYIDQDTKNLPLNTYTDVFTNPKSDYPHWIGYSIAYQLVKTFRVSHPTLEWGEIMKLKPEEVAKPFVDGF
jgi:uncharacterized protein YjaZ